jgi:hypothetical protein
MFDYDGAVASATAVLAVTPIVTSTSYGAGTSPDTPRPLTVTLVDADASLVSCVLTIVGTRADGTVITATTNLTGGSGLKTLSPAYNFATVTSISNGACSVITGGAVDTVSVGTSATVPAAYVAPRGTASKPSDGGCILTPTLTFKNGSAWNWRVENRPVTSAGTTTLAFAVASSGS